MNRNIKHLAIVGILLSVITGISVYSMSKSSNTNYTIQSEVQAKLFVPEDNYLREIINYTRFGSIKEERETFIDEKWVIKVNGVIYPVSEELFNSLTVGDIVEVDEDYSVKLME